MPLFFQSQGKKKKKKKYCRSSFGANQAGPSNIPLQITYMLRWAYVGWTLNNALFISGSNFGQIFIHLLLKFFDQVNQTWSKSNEDKNLFHCIFVVMSSHFSCYKTHIFSQRLTSHLHKYISFFIFLISLMKLA